MISSSGNANGFFCGCLSGWPPNCAASVFCATASSVPRRPSPGRHSTTAPAKTTNVMWRINMAHLIRIADCRLWIADCNQLLLVPLVPFGVDAHDFARQIDFDGRTIQKIGPALTEEQANGAALEDR